MGNRITYLAVFSAILFAFLTHPGYAAPNQEQIEKNLPKLLGASNQGLEFVLGFFPAWVEDRPPNGVGTPGIRLYISSAVKANVKVKVVSKNFEVNETTVPNSTKEIFLPYEIAQVSSKKKDSEVPEPAQVYPGGAVVVTSDAPIVCYGMVRYPYTSDGYLALPVSSLGTEYVVAAYNGPTDDPSSQYLPAYTAVVGAYDGTKVTFTYGGRADGRVETSDGKKLTPGKSDTKTLNKGDVWLIPARGHKPDITGSYVNADKPVACFSGNFCSYIPVTKGYCDHIVEQDIPVHLWGNKYYVTPVIDRKKNSPVRLFASKDNVTIYRDGLSNQVGTIQKMHGPEGEGWIEVRAAEGEPRPVTLFSNDPFNVVQYNPGQDDDGVSSDPFQLTLSPIEQFHDHIAFNTPGVQNGLKFKANYINLVYLATPDGKIPDDMELGLYNINNNEITWTRLSEKFDADPGLRFIDSTNLNPDRNYYCKQVKLPEDGVYHIRANDKFMAYAYGFSDYDSYGFPTAFVTIDHKKKDTLKPRVNFTKDENGNVPAKALSGSNAATVEDYPNDDENRSNLSLVYFDVANSANYKFAHDSFIAGADYKINWSLKPVDSTKDSRAVITFADRNGNDTTVIIEHWTTHLAILPAEKNLGFVKKSKEVEYTFELKNYSFGNTSNLTKLRFEKGDQGFTIDGSYDGTTPLVPDEARLFKVKFRSDIEGEFTDRIGYGDGENFTYVAQITASTYLPSIQVNDIAFPTTPIDMASDSIEASIKNVGTIDVLIKSIIGPQEPAFKSNIEALNINPDNSYNLKVGEELRFKICFAPTQDRLYRDTIFVISDALGEDTVCVLEGVGWDNISAPEAGISTLNVKILPNPLDSRGGQIEFENPSDGTVEIVLFNSLNRQVAVLQSGWMKAGNHSIRIPVETMPSGAYTFKIVIGNRNEIGKFIIEK